MSLKTTAASVLHRVAYASGLSLARTRGVNVARIFMFHGVGDKNYPGELFEAQLKFLQERFEIIKLESLLQQLTITDSWLANSAVLTFDDGLRNNLSVAYPILKKLNAPATFFVCPGLIESQRWLWNQEARARLQSLHATQRVDLASRWFSANSDVENIINWMKTLPTTERLSREQEIRNATKDFQPTLDQRLQCDVLNWDELRSLDPNLITIGSHSVNHPILSTLQSNELQFEIRESRRLLEEKLDRKVEFFCYPNGAFDPNVIAETKKHYRAAVIAEPGFVKPECDAFQLPRIGSTEDTALLAWRLHRPTA